MDPSHTKSPKSTAENGASTDPFFSDLLAIQDLREIGENREAMNVLERIELMVASFAPLDIRRCSFLETKADVLAANKKYDLALDTFAALLELSAKKGITSWDSDCKILNRAIRIAISSGSSGTGLDLCDKLDELALYFQPDDVIILAKTKFLRACLTSKNFESLSNTTSMALSEAFHLLSRDRGTRRTELVSMLMEIGDLFAKTHRPVDAEVIFAYALNSLGRLTNETGQLGVGLWQRRIQALQDSGRLEEAHESAQILLGFCLSATEPSREFLDGLRLTNVSIASAKGQTDFALDALDYSIGQANEIDGFGSTHATTFRMYAASIAYEEGHAIRGFKYLKLVKADLGDHVSVWPGLEEVLRSESETLLTELGVFLQGLPPQARPEVKEVLSELSSYCRLSAMDASFRGDMDGLKEALHRSRSLSRVAGVPLVTMVSMTLDVVNMTSLDGDTEEARSLLEGVEDHIEGLVWPTSPELRAELSGAKAVVAACEQDYSGALAHFRSADDIFSASLALKNTLGSVANDIRMARTLLKVGDAEEAFVTLERASEKLKARNRTQHPMMARVLYELSECHEAIGEYQIAAQVSAEADEIFSQLREVNGPEYFSD